MKANLRGLVLVVLPALALSLADCNQHPALTSEIPALQFIRAFHQAQLAYKRESGHFGSKEQLAAHNRELQLIENRAITAGYEIESRFGPDGYEVIALHKPGPSDRFRYRGFYCDQTGIVRQSLSPARPTATSPPIGNEISSERLP